MQIFPMAFEGLYNSNARTFGLHYITQSVITGESKLASEENNSAISAASRKIPARYTTIVFSFYMASLMALFMCFVIVGINTGIHDGYFGRVFHTYQFAMPVAFVCVLIVRPIVMKLMTLTVERPPM